MRVALVADIEQQAVGAGGVGAEVVDVMECEGELDDAEVGGEVAAVLGDGGEDFLAAFLREGGQLLGLELFEVVGGVVSAAKVIFPVGVPLISGVTVTVKVTVPPFFGSFIAVANAVVRLVLFALSSVSVPLA